MKKLVALLMLAGMVCALASPGCHLAPDPNMVPLLALPVAEKSVYKVDPYITAAAGLQAVGPDKAVELLRNLSKSGQGELQLNERTILLCRMLFTASPGKTFRRPALGGPYFVGGGCIQKSPLEPIEVVDGVPFLIARGYVLSGFPEPAHEYLDYCVKNCAWNTAKYQAKTAPEKQKALEKLLGYLRFRGGLTAEDEQFLSSQIE